MAVGRDFLEGEREARRQLNAELAPHAEALCESYLPSGVKLHGRPMANGAPDRAPLRPLAGDMAKRHNGPPG